MDPRLAELCLAAAGQENSKRVEGQYTRHAKTVEENGLETMMEKKIYQMEFKGVEVLACI